MNKLNIEELNQPVARNIIRIINEKGLKQLYVSQKAGYSKQQFNSMLNGRRIIKVCDAISIAKALDVKVDELYAEGGE